MGKLRSGRGASLLVALLLFMICSVISVVVLTAATAVSGRASKLAESDQRYFSVASAAELLAQELNNQPVKIVQEETKVETTVTTYALVGPPPSEPGPAPDTDTTCRMTAIGDYSLGATWADAGGIIGSFSFPPDTGVGVKGDFLTEMALCLLFGKPDSTGVYKYDARYEPSPGGGSPADDKYAFNLSFGDAGTRPAAGTTVTLTDPLDTGDFTLELKEGETVQTLLQVKGSYLLQRDGLLIITLANDNGDSDAFSLVMTLQADYRDMEESKSVQVSEEVYTEVYEDDVLTNLICTETVTTTTTTTRTSTVTWTVIGIGEKSDVTFDSDSTPGESGGTTGESGGA